MYSWGIVSTIIWSLHLILDEGIDLFLFIKNRHFQEIYSDYGFPAFNSSKIFPISSPISIYLLALEKWHL